MVRLLGALVGLAFSVVLLWSFATGAIAYMKEPPAETVEHKFHKHPKEAHFASDGPFGHFDRAQVQRGFQVYKEVCAACHSINLVAFRNLADLGYTEAEIKQVAKSWPIQVPSVDARTGEPAARPAIASDRFPSPYPNEIAARAANGNAMPPDLSLMNKARHDGVRYVYSLLTGYQNPPADLPKDSRPGTGLYYNPYFPNLNLAMPPPLTTDGQVTYADGTNASVDQMAKDVSAFLTWTAEPKLEARHKTGWAALVFLLFGTVLAYLAYKNIWADRKRKGGVETTSFTDPQKLGPNA